MPEKNLGLNAYGIRTYDLCDVGALLYQLVAGHFMSSYYSCALISHALCIILRSSNMCNFMYHLAMATLENRTF